MTKGWPGCAVVLVLLSQAHGQEIWRQVDEQGHVRYSDQPFAGAVRMEPLGVTGRPVRAASTSESLPAQEESQAATAATGPTLEIAYPATDETVRGAGGELAVRLLVSGNLQDDASFSVLLDGAEASWQGEPPVLLLEEVWRGEHRLQVRILDAAGSEIAVSEEIRFFKREPTAPATQAR